MSEITFKMTAVTNVGLVRTNNEDNFIVNPDLASDDWSIPSDTDAIIPLGKNGCVMVVADGMGGMNAGEVASEIAVCSIRKAFCDVSDFSKVTDTPGHIENFLRKAIVDADSDIKRKVKEDPGTEGMGTTIVVAWFLKNAVHVAWCGDSRAYLFNKASGLSRLSKDHSYVQQLVDSGKLDPDLAFDHPNSNIITRSLGDSNSVAQPDYVCKGLSAGDIVLLCSDGLCGLIRDEEIVDILSSEHEHIDDYREALLQGALEAGGHDNVTIALLECVSVEESELERTLSSTVKPRKKRRGWLWLIILLLVAGGLYYLWHNNLLPDVFKTILQIPAQVELSGQIDSVGTEQGVTDTMDTEQTITE
ncbi:MAG: serine/threonine-protein phosphatase [Bacteroidales bacterium]|nr:serine/threonine-protein phosphatase [Bacteroidales bacterium]